MSNPLQSDAPSEVQTTIDKALALGTLSGEALRSWLYAAAEAGFKSALSTSAASAPSARAVAEKCAEIAANAEAQQLPMHSSAREDILAYAASLPSERAENDIGLCAGHAEAWFCERNHLNGGLDQKCVVCAFVPNGGSAKVPEDPTPEMLDAGDLFFTNASFVSVSPAQLGAIWKAMLAAALSNGKEER